MSQTNRISKNNTRVVEYPNGSRGVVLWRTEVVRVLPDGSVLLDTGGWKTPTTRTRMNQAANEWRLGFSVSFRRGDFIVRCRGRDWNLGDATAAIINDGIVKAAS